VQRGEVWWVNFPEPIGKRPALLLSRDQVYSTRTSVTVASITSTIRHIPVEVSLGVGDGVPRDCVVNLDEIHTLANTRIVDKITTLSEEKMEAVKQAIIYALDLD
jgi:mRNA interferase MazF